MHVRNFPGNKNSRRIRAFERMERQTGRTSDGQKCRTALECSRELDTLAMRIIPQARAEAIRTKKDRSGRVKFK